MESIPRFGGGVLAPERSPDAGAAGRREGRGAQDWERWSTAEQFLAISDEELGQVDPVVMNLVVAKGIPALASLDIGRYVRLADEWAHDLRARMPALEEEFFRTPQDWHGDIDFFRLGLVCWYCDEVLGVAYREDQRNVDATTGIRYTDPTDLFINGVMDTRRGTCGNMSLLHVVLGRRVGLPVFLACVAAHFLCRFDDGTKTINIETTETGHGGFSSRPDDYVLAKHNVPPKAQECGSDLRALPPREMLAMFLAARGRHYADTRRLREAEREYLLARYLFPRHRRSYMAQTQLSVCASTELFNPDERGHCVGLAQYLQELVRACEGTPNPVNERVKKAQNPQEKTHGNRVDAVFQQVIVGEGFV